MEEKKELSKVILDTCDKELDGSIGFMLTEREADTFATAILSAGYIKKSEIECDEAKVISVLFELGVAEGMVSLSRKNIAHAIAEHLKDIIK